MKLTSKKALEILENFRGTTQSDKWIYFYSITIEK